MKWSSEAKIGLAVLSAAVILIVGVVLLRGIDLRSKQYALRVFYTNVNGLKTGDLVTVAGLSVGRVESMVLVGRRIAVELTIQTQVKLAKDSRATLKSETIMGGKFIEIAPGVANGVLADGDSLGGDYEADLSELTATLSPISSNVLSILENVNSTFDDPTRARIKAIVADLARSSAGLKRVVRSGGESANTAFADFSAFSRDLARFARTLDSIAQKQGGTIDTSMASLRRLSANAERLSASLDAASGDLADILKTVRRGDGTLGRFVYDDKLYHDLDSLACHFNDLVVDVRSNPQRYVSVHLF
jgi:phospholipid/cholesterol/gamma-HCH transport system substrate-binding protein